MDNSKDITLWRLHIRPKGGNASDRPEDVIRFCLNGGDLSLKQNENALNFQGCIGLGWFVGEEPISTYEEYKRKADVKHIDANNKRTWHPVRRFILELKVGDLVWFRDTSGVYYLARVTGEWEYRPAPTYEDLDVPNIREAAIAKISTRVPGKIANSFIPSSTLQRISSLPMLLYSMTLWNKAWKGDTSLLIPEETIRKLVKRLANDDPDEKSLLFALLPPEDLEDLVALYLQETEGYMLIPSSRGKRDDTIGFEYELSPRFSNAAHAVNALAQVKTSETLNIAEYASIAKELRKRIYLFTASDNYVESEQTPWVEKISSDQLLKFWEQNVQLLPEHLQHWQRVKNLLLNSTHQ